MGNLPIDGGPAFPILSKIKISGEYDEERICSGTTGLSVRDYLAAQALISVITIGIKESYFDPAAIAIDAYKIADAMLEARQARATVKPGERTVETPNIPPQAPDGACPRAVSPVAPGAKSSAGGEGETQ